MFKSFFLAGFECATGYNVRREWIDQIAATQHDRFVDHDYDLLEQTGIRGVRESIRWPLVDRKGGYDFSSVRPLVDAVQRHEFDAIWDIFHYGYPPGLDLFSPEFPERFADYCYATARYLERRSNGRPLFFTPVNEPSFFSWAGGEVGRFAPHCQGMAYDLKIALIRAAIQGINAIWAASPNARMVNADALCRVVAPEGASEETVRDVEFFNERAVYESWDMLAGRILPELGGTPKHLDIVGLNYYWTNQWQIDRVGEPLDPQDPRCWTLGQMIQWAQERTGHPVMITETGHVGDNRAPWMHEMARECENVIRDGVPLLGVCLYPILGMPEWHDQDVWTRMGMWDLLPDDDSDRLLRVPHEPTHAAFASIGPKLERLHAKQQIDEIDALLRRCDFGMVVTGR